MRHPFQCLEVCSLAGTADANVLIAAAGSYIYSYSLNDGSLLATWPPSEIEGEGAIRENVQGGGQATRKRREVIPGSVEVNGDIEPPGKRRKLSAPGETSDSTSTEIVVEGATDVGASRMGPRPAVIKLATTSDGKYVIAVTGDDKCIRVLKLLQDGVLQELSERQMPKRPCAITVTPDNATILCADKFGDVYSLPLLGSPLENFNSATTGTEKLKNQSPDTTGKAFVPAASSLTVHTKKNQQALRNQLKVINKTTEKKIFSFEHQLLLGHVSLLTDLAYVTFDARSSRSEGSRSYILTSDRDEHIRVSRGIPQAHIIEGYCLGHTEFVNKIIVPYWRRQVLISGGGDDYLSVWDWVAGTMLQKADLLHPFNCFQDTLMCSRMRSSDLGVDSAKRDRNRIKIAVSGIWAMKHRVPSDEGYEGELFVACEGVPALFRWSITTDGLLKYRQFHSFPGNILDVVVLEQKASIIGSIDNVHEAGSKEDVRSDEAQEAVPRVHSLSFGEVSEVSTDVQEADLASVTNIISKDRGLRKHRVQEDVMGLSKALSELLYGVEHLRKRSPDD